MEDLVKEIAGLVGDTEKYRHQANTLYEFLCFVSPECPPFIGENRFYSGDIDTFVMRCSVCENFVCGSDETVNREYYIKFGDWLEKQHTIIQRSIRDIDYLWYTSPVRLCPDCIKFDLLFGFKIEIEPLESVHRCICLTFSDGNTYRVTRDSLPRRKVFKIDSKIKCNCATVYMCEECLNVHCPNCKNV